MRLTTVTLLALVAVACEPAYAGTFSTFGPIPGGSKRITPSPAPNLSDPGPPTSPNPNTSGPSPEDFRGAAKATVFRQIPFEAVYKPVPLDAVLRRANPPKGFSAPLPGGSKKARGVGGVTKVRGQQ